MGRQDVGKAIVGREVTFDFSKLDEALIRKDTATAIFNLYFEVTDPLSVVRRIALSDEPDKWIGLPAPPLATALKLSGSDDERYETLMRARIAWATDVNRYGSVDIPSFEISSFSSQEDTNSEEGLNACAIIECGPSCCSLLHLSSMLIGQEGNLVCH